MKCSAVKGYEGCYEVSDTGRIFSLARTAVGRDGVVYPFKAKEKIPTLNKKLGYFAVELYKNNIASRQYIHRLVAKAFITNPDNKLEVNHIDSDRTNNYASNLEWVTRTENVIHGYKYGYMSQKPRRKLTDTDYLKIFTAVTAGSSIAIAIADYPIQVPAVSVNLKKLTKKWGVYDEYMDALKQQRIERARVNGAKNTR